MRVTKKQNLLLAAISKLNADGSFLDIDEVLETLEYKTTKQSLQFSIRALIKNGFVLKQDIQLRRGKGRVSYSLTKEGYELYKNIR